MENEMIKNHKINISKRNKTSIEGLTKLESFSKDEFLMITDMGRLQIQGHELSLGNLDIEKGEIIINGRIDALIYLDNQKEKESFFKKLFK